MLAQAQPHKLPSAFSLLNEPTFEVLYSEEGDGEIRIERDPLTGTSKLVTIVDIGTLYKEKRSKAILMAQTYCKLSHRNIVTPLKECILDEMNFLYFEMEAPENIGQWKSFCKKKFGTDEMLQIFRSLCKALDYLHQRGIVHRDVHPTRIHSLNGVTKFNPIGMPYNFKKLLKKENFCGHVNYSAPELIIEKHQFSSKVDTWSLGCCLYYLCTKKDPFEGKDPAEIKRNILAGRLEKTHNKIDPILRQLIDVCLIPDEYRRPSAFQLLQILNEIELKTYGKILVDPIEEVSRLQFPNTPHQNGLKSNGMYQPYQQKLEMKPQNQNIYHTQHQFNHQNELQNQIIHQRQDQMMLNNMYGYFEDRENLQLKQIPNLLTQACTIQSQSQGPFGNTITSLQSNQGLNMESKRFIPKILEIESQKEMNNQNCKNIQKDYNLTETLK